MSDDFWSFMKPTITTVRGVEAKPPHTAAMHQADFNRRKRFGTDRGGTRGSTPAGETDRAPSIGAKQGRSTRQYARQSQQDPVAGSGKLCPTQPDGDGGRRSLNGAFTGRGPGDETKPQP